ncbi:aspartic peptidase domain-containing protein [Parasitella parasitica]|nr:aspartic peptidase domain-containing protein [Parasitella parasitica]
MQCCLGLLLLTSLTTSALADKIIRFPIIEQPTPQIAKRDIGVASLFNFNAREYIIEIGLGTPVQKFNVTLDTGRFNEKNSSTLNQTGKAFDTQYGSGSAKGLLAYESITVIKVENQNDTITNWTSPNHLIGLANTTSGMYTSPSNTRVSGILGLGLRGLQGDPSELSFVEKLYNNGVIDDAVFSIFLNKQANHGYTGEIVFGGLDEGRLVGNNVSAIDLLKYNREGRPNIGLSYRKNTTDMTFKYWAVAGQGVSSNKIKQSQIFKTKYKDVVPVILDTGTTLSYLPEQDVIGILETITKDYVPLELNGGASQGYQVNCSDFTKQDMWFDFGLTEARGFTDEPAIIRVPLVEMALPQDAEDINSATSCLFGLAPISNNSPHGYGWILGQTVLRSAYVIIRLPIRRQARPDPVISSMQQQTGLSKRDPSAAALYNEAGSQYLVDVSIGTPAQNFSVTLDTGSADLWVPGSSCSQADCPNGHFDQTASTTFKSLDKDFALVYGIGAVNGTYVTDTVTVAGATVHNQQFALASTTSQLLTNTNLITASQARSNESLSTRALASTATTENPVANGILGLGYPKLTGSSSKGLGVYNPFVFNLVANDVISDPVFSIYLNKASPYGWVGEIIFGGVDSTKYTGNLTYLPVASLSSTKSSGKKRASLPDNDSNYYWMVGAQGVAVADSSSAAAPNTTANSTESNVVLDLPFSSPSAFILDTGTTLTYLPSAMAQKIVEAFAGQDYSLDENSGTYIVNCEAAKSTAQLELKMASSATAEPVVVSVPASQLVLPLDGASAESAMYCFFGVAPIATSSIGNNLYLVGDSVLRSIYMVYDLGQNRVGIAAAAGVAGSVKGISNVSTSSSSSLPKENHIMIALVSCLFAVVLSF